MAPPGAPGEAYPLDLHRFVVYVLKQANLANVSRIFTVQKYIYSKQHLYL